MQYFLLNIALFVGSVTLVASHGYYSVLAPGYIKSNRNYTVFVTLHHAPEATKINIMLEGPTYEMLKVMFLQPFECRAVTFLPPKLTEGHHRLIVEGVNGLRFRNETMLTAFVDAGPKIYIQTDKAIYKPGDEVQFRVVLMNEHTRPLNISEPIRIEIMDGNANRVKQFKDISLVKGVYKNKFQLSEYPVMGLWQIRVYISGRYDFAATKKIKVQKYLLSKFSLYIETPSNIILGDPMVVRALIYGQYTFGKYVEGQVKIRLLLDTTDVVVEEKEYQIKDLLNVELPLNHTELLQTEYHINMHVELKEKHTGRTRNETIHICTRKYPYQIYILHYTIKFAKGIPYQFRTKVRYWNDLPIADNATTPLIMEHGNRNYSAFLDANGEATYQFEHDPNSQHIFRYGNTTHISANIFHYLPYTGNATELPCKLELLVEEPKLGSPVRVKVTFLRGMPYLVYTIVGHANIIHTQHIKLPAQPTTYVLEITPSIEMVPYAFVYVHYIDGGNLRYGEIKIKFPLEFENE
uniref:TEP1-F n=1 Tax=Musca domestica TaxID=7370 RepID=A0A1I8MHC8_MUSDO